MTIILKTKGGCRIMDYNQKSLDLHLQNRGKLGIVSKVPLETKEDLSLAYTPGVAMPCREIYKDKRKVYDYTIKGNLVAVVTDGTAVLGLGNIGPEAALPVMEGKAALFKHFAGIDAIPICLDTTNVDEIVETVIRIAPTFGGINLEDIASPNCFEVEKRLKEALDIPVFHDDQHGTAIVVTAALLNALKISHKNIEDIHIVLNGPGAAGTAIIHMLIQAGAKDIIACDENGILDIHEVSLEAHKKEICRLTNPRAVMGGLQNALKGADVFIGVSVPQILTAGMIEDMNRDPIIFAMANPIPEIMPDAALKAGAKIVGTGRSDFPNQINNLLAFPGVFKGAFMAGAEYISNHMKLAAAKAIADMVPDERLSPSYILPDPLHSGIAQQVANAVAEAYCKENTA